MSNGESGDHETLRQFLQHIHDLAGENTHSPQDGYAMIEEWSRKALWLINEHTEEG